MCEILLHRLLLIYLASISICFSPVTSQHQCKQSKEYSVKLEYKWNYVNYTWPSTTAYEKSIQQKTYIPENNAIVGIKIYKHKLYFSVTRYREGIPVTLAYIDMKTSSKTNPPLIPYPSWEMNVQPNCSTLQSVQSMEIDTKGIMWVLDGHRTNNNTKCPPKIVWLDINNGGKITRMFTLPNEICLHQGCFLNDIVIDESDSGSFAYMSDTSSIDPGLIIYSFQENRAWKIRDKTMYQELNAANFVVDGVTIPNLAAINGIVLSPLPNKEFKERVVYFCALTAYSLYSIKTSVLKNEQLCRTDSWRKNVTFVGKKQSQTDGMVMDNEGNLFTTLITLNAVGIWNINQNFDTARILAKDDENMIWPDCFAFDDFGNLFVLANRIHQYNNPKFPLKLQTSVYQFQIFKIHTGTRSYLYR